MNYRSFALAVSLTLAASLCPGQSTPNRAVQQQLGPPAVNQTRVPDGFALDAAHEKYLNQILAYWEHTTASAKRYRCTFRRWEYESGQEKEKTYAEGTIQYAAPDKGLFHVTQVKHRVPPKEPGGAVEWRAGQFMEHWVCDGRSIFEFDYNNKQLKQRPLPPEMQGVRITDGPLPFLFGAKKDQIRNRLWLRVDTPKDAKGEYWLLGVPKTLDDAANFARIHIILDESDFLPKGMILYHRNQAQTTFQFNNRESNWNILAEKLNLFHRQFFEPKVPGGWQKVVEPIGARTAVAPNPRGIRQALQPQPGPRRR
jgi:TIGR03009 family protein